MSIVAVFVAMFIFYVFSRLEKSKDLVIRSVGYSLLIVSGAAFTFFIGLTAWLALECGPPDMAYLFSLTTCARTAST